MHPEINTMFHSATTYSQDRGVLTIVGAITTALLWAGGLLSEDEVRWILLTMAVALPTAGMLSMGLKKLEETLQLVLCRAFLAFAGGVLGPHPFFQYFHLDSRDGIALLGSAFLGTLICFALVLPFLNLLIKRSDTLAAKFLDHSLVSILGDRAPVAPTMPDPPSTPVPTPE